MVHLFRECLILTGTAHSEVLALGSESCCLVAVGRYAEFVAHTLGELARQFCALLESDSAHGNKRAYVGGTHAGMRSVMVAHVDKLSGLSDSAESGLAHSLRLTDKSNYSTVGGLAGIHVQQTHFSTLFNLSCDCVDHGAVAAFAEIRHALYNLFHYMVCIMVTGGTGMPMPPID